MSNKKRIFNAESKSGLGGTKDWGKVIMTFPLIEVALALFFGLIFYFVLKNKTLAELTWILGPALSISRRALELHLENHFHQLTMLTSYVDFIQSDIGDSFRRIIQLYAQVSEADFREIKDGIIKNTEAKLARLAHNKCSDELNTGEYFDWLFRFLKNTRSGERIWAISMNLDIEWNESQEEETFLQLNLDAAARNVTVERIFVVSENSIEQFLENTYVKRQLEDESHNLIPRFVTKEHLEKVDKNLLKSLGEGIIAVDEHVVLVDIASNEGFRGIVTMNPTEIEMWSTRFRQLRVYASEFSSIVKSNSD